MNSKQSFRDWLVGPLFAFSVVGVVASIIAHILTYIGIVSLRHGTVVVMLILVTASGALVNKFAQHAYLKAIYDYYRWEWKLPGSMNLEEKHRLWRLYLTIWKRKHLEIGMPNTPQWMRFWVFPLLFAGIVYFGVVFPITIIILGPIGLMGSPTDNPASFYFANSFTFLNVVGFFCNLSILYSKFREAHMSD
jgi:hypothetical protein